MAIEFQQPEDDEIDPNESTDEREDRSSEQTQGDDTPVQGADSEGADELDEDQEQEEVDIQPEKPSRGESRIQRLANEAREAKEEAAKVRRELDEFRARQQAPQPVQEREPTPDEMALWSTDQIVDHRMRKGLEPLKQQLQQAQFQVYETGDKANFATVCARDPRAAKMADEVERELLDQRAKGVNIQREALYTFMLGKKMREGGLKAAAKQKQDGQRRIARQQAPSGNSRSDQSAGRRELSEKEARDKRLKDAGFFT